MQLDRIGWVVVVAGLALAAFGVLLVVGGRLGLGRLPGDIAYRGRNTAIYVPLASCLLISLVVTLVLNLFGRR